MPLARIISHSTSGCRDLAMDLLARGYAVEIVEPDKVPDNFADLELRVEASMLKPVAADSAVQDGGHSASLDFVQHMREPMPNFLRRPPTRDDLIAAGIVIAPEPKVVAEIKPQPKIAAEVNVQQKAVGEIGPAVTTVDCQAVAVTTSPKAIPGRNVVEEVKPPAPASNQEPAPESGTRNLQLISKQELPQITAPEQISLPASEREGVSTPIKEPAKRSRRRITIRIPGFRLNESARKITSNTFMRSNGAFLRASVGFAATVALGCVLLIGVRGSDARAERAVPNSKNDDVKGTLLPQASLPAAAPKDPPSASQSAKQGPLQSSRASGSPMGKSKGDTPPAKDLKPEAPTEQRDKPSLKTTVAGKNLARHHHGDDLIAKDTVTYLKK